MTGKVISMLRFRYQTFEFGNTDIHVRTLRDRQEYSDPEHIAAELGISSANWALFGIIWASGEILANLMSDHDIEGKKILEIGCGIGLASLVLNSRSADITSTDYHPEAEKFLADNVKLNNSRKIPFVRTGWGDQKTRLGTFDLIIGSDLLYEQDHAELLAGFIDQHADDDCEIIIIDPGRKNHARFSRNMEDLGFTLKTTKYLDTPGLTQPARGCKQFHIHSYSR
jgi:predicted nicotinamide N-methyase